MNVDRLLSYVENMQLIDIPMIISGTGENQALVIFELLQD